MLRRHGFLLALAVGALLHFVPTADANTRLCRQLEAELASAGRGGGSPAKVRRYDAAIARQREQMAIARDQARDGGCGHSLTGRAVRQCAAINATLDRMVRNLDTLQRDRARLAKGSAGRSKKTLLAALDANGCRGGAVAEAPPRPVREPPTRLREMLATADPGGEALDDEPIDGAPFAADETFRTMCVRSCDGYFYPMSNAATVRDFGRDQKNCETSCPGTDMQIFYGPPNTDDPASMLSIRGGTAYSSLPTAFQHRDVSVPRPEGCGCNVARNFEVIAGTPPSAGQSAPTGGDSAFTGIPLPTPRPDGTGDAAVDAAALPEPAPQPQSGSIIAVEPPPARLPPAGNADAAAPAPDAAPPAPAEPDAHRSIRIVGPKFLPDPAGALDLRQPAPTSAP